MPFLFERSLSFLRRNPVTGASWWSFRRWSWILFWMAGWRAGLAVAAVDTNRLPEPPTLLRVKPMELLSAFPQPARFEPIVFPSGYLMSSISGLALTDGRLWISSRPRGDTNLTKGQGRLWTLSFAENRMEPVQGSLASDAVRDLLIRPDGVWVAVEGGVVALDPQTFVFDPFGAGQGITTRQFAGFAQAGRRLFVLGQSGPLYELKTDGRAWRRRDPAALPANPRELANWKLAAGSGDWLLALGDRGSEMTFRQVDAPDWGMPREELLKLIPREEPPIWNAVVGDQSGGFWLGSDAGLHFLVAETGSLEHHVSPVLPTIAGGWGRTFGPHHRPSAALKYEIVNRQATDLRMRMRMRARLARLAREIRLPLDPVTPTSRLPSGVRALALDGTHLWVATGDPVFPERSRILLLHVPKRQWLGWFPVGRPVTAMAADATHLYVGLDIESQPAAVPIYRVEKAPLVTVPAGRRLGMAVAPDEWVARQAGMSERERAVRAFFSGNHSAVIRLLESDPDPDAEALFLLAFSHDPIGLNVPEKYQEYLGTLGRKFPDSPWALATASLRAAPVSALPEEGATVPPEPQPAAAGATLPAPPAATPGPAGRTKDDAIGILARRDLNKDGRINLIEFRLWRGPKEELKPFDRNGDGQLDLEELRWIP